MYRKKASTNLQQLPRLSTTTTVKCLMLKYRIPTPMSYNRIGIVSFHGLKELEALPFYSPFVRIIWMWHFYYRKQWNHLLHSIRMLTDWYLGHWTLDIRTVVVILNAGQNKLKTNYRLLSAFLSPFFLTQFSICHSDNYYLFCWNAINESIDWTLLVRKLEEKLKENSKAPYSMVRNNKKKQCIKYQWSYHEILM